MTLASNPSLPRRALMVLLAIGIVWMAGRSASASAPDLRPESGKVFVQVGLDYLFLQDISGAGIGDTDISTLGLRLGVFYRFSAIDLGLVVGHQGLASFETESNGRAFAGAQAYAVGALRWRWLERGWGAYTVGLRVGVMAFLQTDALIQQAAADNGRQIPKHGMGWATRTDIGGLFYLTPTLWNEIRFAFSYGGLGRTESRESSFDLFTLILSYGIEFGM